MKHHYQHLARVDGRPGGEWGGIFSEQVLAGILDRLLHHAVTINMRGESYRLKDKRKAGVLASQGVQARS